MATNTQLLFYSIAQRQTGRCCFALLFLLTLLTAFAQLTAAAATTYYVDADATGTNSGTSWANAFPKLQDAVTKATSGDTIWLAEGVYYPDEGTGQTNNNKNARFNLPSGAKLYGGFDPSSGADTFAARDPAKYISVLSGDIDQNDTTDATGVVTTTSGLAGTNSLHVVYLDGQTVAVTSATVIDGVVITAGAAVGAAGSGASPSNSGGGLYCAGEMTGNVCSPTLANMIFSGNEASENGGAIFNDGSSNGMSSPTLTNVTFSGNSASFGGASYNYGDSSGTSSPTLTNVTFSANTAATWGGAMFNNANKGTSSPTLTNVTFSSNQASDNGGAIYNYGTNSGTSSPTLTSVTFSANTAGGSGGAMFNSGGGGTSSPTLTNVSFSGNSATQGGAMSSAGSSGGTSSSTLTNVSFSGNSASGNGGALRNDGNNGTSRLTLTNVSFSGNKATNGGAIFHRGSNGGTSSLTLVNAIVWNNAAGQGASVYNQDANAAIRFSILENGQTSTANIGSSSTTYDSASNKQSDPLFVQPISPATAPTTSGDLHLQAGSPAVDAGDTSAVPSGVTTDRDGNPRIVNSTVDIGAYEVVSPIIISGTPPAGSYGQPYSFTFAAKGVQPITFGVSGALPPGLTLDPASGVLSSTPTQVGSFTFTITASNGSAPNASQAVTLTIAPALLTVTAVTKTRQVGVSNPPLDYLVAGLVNGDTAQRALSGTLATTATVSSPPGSYAITQGTLAASSNYSLAFIAGTLVVTTEPTTAPTIISATPPAGSVGQPYTFSFNATGTTPITFIVSGTLPPGLSLDPATGVLSGTPTQTGTFSFTVRASNGTTPDASQSVTITIAVQGSSTYRVMIPLIVKLG